MSHRHLIKDIPLDERIAMVNDKDGVTLDGHPAYVSGYRNDFATVHRRDGRGGDVQFAWATVQHILSTHRSFKS